VVVLLWVVWSYKMENKEGLEKWLSNAPKYGLSKGWSKQGFGEVIIKKKLTNKTRRKL